MINIFLKYKQAINYNLPLKGRYSETWKKVLELNLSINTSKKKMTCLKCAFITSIPGWSLSVFCLLMSCIHYIIYSFLPRSNMELHCLGIGIALVWGFSYFKEINKIYYSKGEKGGRENMSQLTIQVGISKSKRINKYIFIFRKCKIC